MRRKNCYFRKTPRNRGRDLGTRARPHTQRAQHLIGSVSRKLDLRFLRVALTMYKSTASDGKALIISTQSRRGPTLPISLFMEAAGNNVSPRC